MSHNGLLYIETVGCQMNVLDSELVVAALRQQGYSLTTDPKEADTVLFNTCSVREHAEEKIYSQLGRLKFARRSRPDVVIGVIGCMAQKDQDLIFRRAPHVDMIVGTGQLAEIPKLVDVARSTRKRQMALSLDRKEGSRTEVAASFESYDPLRDPEMRPTPWQAYVRIMIGCDKFCTYCVVPMTRGPEQSRLPRDILREVEALAAQGVREVTLLGQTVNSYKVTQDGRLWRMSDLIAAIHENPAIQRIKFVTNYPKDMTLDLLEAIRDLPKVSRYLHVPLQSGCDEVLKRMKRGYTTADYRDMMERINKTVPDVAVSSDFIVGFCGESDESFRKSLDAVREYRFKNSFIFKYSPRKGTKAFDLYPDDVAEDVKRRRNQELLTLQNAISEEDNAEMIGRQVEVLVEGPSKWAAKGREIDAIPGWHGGAAVGEGKAEGHSHHEEHTHAGSGSREIHHNDGFVPLSVIHSEETSKAVAAPGVSLASLAPTPATQSGALQLTGRTMCDRIVVFEGNPRLSGTLTTVAIDDCTPTTLIGRIVTREVQHGSSGLLPILM
ncbi:tRNA-2-methylthio-N(6)-dimethylallyladenosine synthase [Caulifigura coniformis]|uniref:tRNA-2-methylthio-N(6)-dimethylallyladenosine synthase n=1 Tax=Caulifigura coniformis TaxID=2527983 RepID=A0A517S8H2_9PLAN|nr:tRNA (N6-isopentenyl adenosine(37)-C2)-methylthiotransferase MiaB [Caulifigura coniformis]QDT52419.1 tRNA-2-methylthio-N(6)-dimethylallyladenosine synthase [Caulifigura coniformis]